MRAGFIAVLVLVLAGSAAAGWSPAVEQRAVDADTVLIEAALQPSGAAVWTVEHRVRLETANETTAFEELRADVRANESRYASAFRQRMNGTIDTAQARTGRSMAIENVSVTATIKALGRSTGVLTYRFRWTGFAAQQGDRLVAGDALAGLYLDDSTVLTVAWPANYSAAAVRPEGERGNRSVTWYGPHDFGPNEPHVAVSPEAMPSGEGATGLPLWPGLIVAVAIVAGAYWWHARRADAESGAENATGDSSGAADRDEGSPPPAESGDGDESLLRNDEQVRRLLLANGGRMKQQAIADELDWTDAKTSQVVGDLREEEVVETFRIGRENVVELVLDEDHS